MHHSFISTSELAQNPYSKIIGYPHATKQQIRQRILEIEKLKVRSVSFVGPTSIGELDILGKGYVGVVVLAKIGTKEVALKIRRTDSQRDDMRNEGAMLRKANSVNVGPRLYGVSKNCMVMEYVEGLSMRDWVGSIHGRGSSRDAKHVIKKILEDCYRLDEAGIDHGELSSISKHVRVGKAVQSIIDFDSSSTQRRVANVTSAAQSIFIGSGISKKVRRIYSVPAEPDLIDLLRQYKKERTLQSFEALLHVLRLG